MGPGRGSFPAGTSRCSRTIEACALREVAEETGLRVTDLTRGPFTNDLFAAEGRHYVTLYRHRGRARGRARVREPEKCAEWRWCEWDALPEPLFLPIENLKAQGYRPPSAA